MRDDTECERCTGREGPAIIAASVLVPVVIVGVPLLVMRIEHTRAFAYKFYHRFIDVGKFKACARLCLSGHFKSLDSARAGRLCELCHHVLNQLESRHHLPSTVSHARKSLLNPRAVAAPFDADGVSCAV